MTQKIQISGKSNSGVIVAVGGDSYEDILANLTALTDDPGTARSILSEAVRLIVPLNAGSSQPEPSPVQQAIQNVQAGFGQQVQPVQQYQQPAAPQQYGNQNDSRGGFQNAGPPPGQQTPLCPNHNAPARWVEGGTSKATGRPYAGFWSCSVAQQGDRSCKVRG